MCHLLFESEKLCVASVLPLYHLSRVRQSVERAIRGRDERRGRGRGRGRERRRQEVEEKRDFLSMSDVPRKRDGSVASVSTVVEKKLRKSHQSRGMSASTEKSVRLFLFVYF